MRTYTCALVCVRASISRKLLRTPSLAPCIPRAILSWIDAHFSIFAIKRPCRRGVDAKERNYMDHFDGRKKKRGRKTHSMERPGNVIAARNGDFQRRARWLNKLRRSLSVFFSFFFFFYWIIYKLILTSFLICRKFLLWTHAAFCFLYFSFIEKFLNVVYDTIKLY